MRRPRVELSYRIVDVFSDRPLAGNALAVVLDPCPEPVMPAIARELNLSETAFPSVTAPGAYEVRIFTPTRELPFAGHPSLGAAWVLGPGRWTQTSPGATVPVAADEGGAELTQPDAVFVEVDDRPAAGALGVGGLGRAWVAESAGNRQLLVPTESPIHDLGVDLRRLAEVLAAARCSAAAAFTVLDASTLHVRAFLPGAGIPEDPGTGSAAGPIGVLARRIWHTDTDVTIRQGDEIGRPCRIEVHAEEGAVRVGGRVAPCAEGVLTL